jgi:hypothetical protein
MTDINRQLRNYSKNEGVTEKASIILETPGTVIYELIMD